MPGLEHIAVIGGGAWGTALAHAACLGGRRVTLVVRDTALVEEILTHHSNRRYLPGVTLDAGLAAATALPPADAVILAVPAQASRQALTALGPGALAGLPVILTAKGLEANTLKRQSEILAECAPGAVPFVLSGPSFAADVARGRPTAVTLAGASIAEADAVSAALAGPSLRLYASADLVGVELVGALKNVYALACGAVEGAQLGLSARSALIARAHAEMARMVSALGGEAATLSGLAGIGDLTLSCTSPQSRNYSFGMALGAGRSLAALTEDGHALAEGVPTTPVARALAQKAGVEMPLVEAVAALLEGSHAITDIVAGLMSRPLKRET
jgi:glycerol-3-phosphate dehydrogenase (NAD(P)+)